MSKRPGGATRAWIRIAALALLFRSGAAAAAPDVEVKLSRPVLSVGETVTLEILVHGASGVTAPPEFGTPAGVEILSTGKAQNYSWVNGRSGTETVFRYELGASSAGTYQIGPFAVRIGTQLTIAPAIGLTVTAAPARVEEGGGGAAMLQTDVEPRNPYVGQPIVLRVRLIQRAQLAEDPQYVPPATPGFWSEPASRPESYYAAEGQRRVLVTETRARLYPLAVGEATVGEATALLAIAQSGSDDPAMWTGGRVPRREVRVHSAPVTVRVRPLPAGAPASFRGAVGAFSVRWSVDRTRTPRDVPATVRLDVRGVGNLPLARAPDLEDDDLEVFVGATEDSLPSPGSEDAGRRRFQWTVLPRREGTIRISPPDFSWFDPAVAAYRHEELQPFSLDVGPAINAGAGGRERFPQVFEDQPLDPLARAAEPWAFALAGLALGVALALARSSMRPPPDVAERAMQREWLRAVGLGRGADFWRAAEEASAWLEARQQPIGPLRRQIAAARYGGDSIPAERVRSRLVEALGRALPPAGGPLPARIGAAALALAAVALCVLFSPRGGDPVAAARARAADRAARSGDVAAARREWTALWRDGSRSPDLAARLAWGEVRNGEVGSASVWVLEGERTESRDRALGWVADRVREGGGLVGAAPVRLPIRRIEWAIIALLLSATAGSLWPRRGRVALLLALSLAAAIAAPLETWRARHLDRAVVRGPVALEGTGVALEPGQVVRIVSHSPGRVQVAAGAGVDGWVPANSVYSLEELR